MRSARAEESEGRSETPTSNEDLSFNGFSPQQTEYLQLYAAAPYMSNSAICRELDIAPQKVSTWRQRSQRFRQALRAEQQRSERVANLNRKVVIRGMFEAIDMAKDMKKPGTMISGWKEVARMCGYYEPERRVIELSTDNQQLLEQIQTLPRAKLLELMQEHSILDAQESQEGEFEVVDARPLEDEHD